MFPFAFSSQRDVFETAMGSQGSFTRLRQPEVPAFFLFSQKITAYLPFILIVVSILPVGIILLALFIVIGDFCNDGEVKVRLTTERAGNPGSIVGQGVPGILGHRFCTAPGRNYDIWGSNGVEWPPMDTGILLPRPESPIFSSR